MSYFSVLVVSLLLPKKNKLVYSFECFDIIKNSTPKPFPYVSTI